MNANLSLNVTENGNSEPEGAASAAASSIRNPQSAIRNGTASPSPASAAAPPASSPRRYRSNISRLPHPVLEMLNAGLREGEDYQIIIARVMNLVGKTPCITSSMLSRWFKTGYLDWLREKKHLENTIAQSDAALTRLACLSRETGADLPDLLATFLASLLQKALQDFDPERLNALLAEKPAELFRLISCLNSHIAVRSQHNQAQIARVRCHIQVAEKAQSCREIPVPAKNIYEAEMMSRVLPSPWDQLKSSLERRIAAEERRKKRCPASPTRESDAPERD